MVQGIRDDSVFLAEQWLEQTTVSVETCGVKDRVLSLEIVGDGCFQLLVQILRSTDETNGRHTITVCIHGFFRGLDQSLVIGQAKIVVGAEVQNITSGIYFDVGSLWRSNDTLVLV